MPIELAFSFHFLQYHCFIHQNRALFKIKKQPKYVNCGSTIMLLHMRTFPVLRNTSIRNELGYQRIWVWKWLYSSIPFSKHMNQHIYIVYGFSISLTYRTWVRKSYISISQRPIRLFLDILLVCIQNKRMRYYQLDNWHIKTDHHDIMDTT